MCLEQFSARPGVIYKADSKVALMVRVLDDIIVAEEKDDCNKRFPVRNEK